MEEYYRRRGISKAIIDFVYSGNPAPQREGGFYNGNIDGIQRHTPDDDGDSVLVIDSQEELSKALRVGATAFYSSYWRYSDPSEPSGIRGRDLVWSIRAEEGGLSVAKKATTLFIESLEEEGFSHPSVKYSGELGFDVLIPLEDVQTGSPSDLDFLSDIHSDLTNSASDYIESRSSFGVAKEGSGLRLTGNMGTCLLTELRWSRGLLLAPMSLHPSSGLVSVPLLPREVPEFSVVEASPGKVRPRDWDITQVIPSGRIEPRVQREKRTVPMET